MKELQFAAFIAVSMIVFAGATEAQKKTTKKTSGRTSTSHAALPPLEVRAAREKVDNQLANVNQFIDVLGPVAQAIEDMDDSARSKPLSRKASDQNAANKEKLIIAIRNLKAGLTDLESDFRTKPGLQKYLTNIQGISQLGAEAEDSAIAGRFVAAKDPLRSVSQKLTDTLKVLPASPPI